MWRVFVEDCPGFGEFEGHLYDTVAAVDSRGPLGLVIDDDDEIYVIPMKYVTYVTST